VRQANDEAKGKIEEYKRELEDTYAAYQAENSGTGSADADALAVKTDKAIADRAVQSAAKKDAVIDLLVGKVMQTA